MRYQEDLRVALRDRLRRLMTAKYTTYGTEIDLLVSWIATQPVLSSILVQAQATDTQELDIPEWIQTSRSMRGPAWPSGMTESGRAVLVWRFLQHMSADTQGSIESYATLFSHERSFDDALRDMTDAVVSPLLDYLSEQIGTDTTVLYLLERAKARLEWFDRDYLYGEYKAETSKGESVYDRYLRKFLFDQGTNMPLSQVRSASGLSDISADLHSDDGVLIEVKLFDANSHGKAALATGVTQSVQYAKDHGQRLSHLVIINLSGRVLELPSDGPVGQWPPHISVSGITVYLVEIRSLPTASASKQGKLSPITLSFDDLVAGTPVDI